MARTLHFVTRLLQGRGVHVEPQYHRVVQEGFVGVATAQQLATNFTGGAGDLPAGRIAKSHDRASDQSISPRSRL